MDNYKYQKNHFFPKNTKYRKNGNLMQNDNCKEQNNINRVISSIKNMVRRDRIWIDGDYPWIMS